MKKTAPDPKHSAAEALKSLSSLRPTPQASPAAVAALTLNPTAAAVNTPPPKWNDRPTVRFTPDDQEQIDKIHKFLFKNDRPLNLSVVMRAALHTTTLDQNFLDAFDALRSSDGRRNRPKKAPVRKD